MVLENSKIYPIILAKSEVKTTTNSTIWILAIGKAALDPNRPKQRRRGENSPLVLTSAVAVRESLTLVRHTGPP